MAPDTPPAHFEQESPLPGDSPTLVEGLPGRGMVASIAVDQLTDQLGLAYHGSLQSPAFSPVAAFNAGRIREPVRVNAGADPAVMTLESDVPIPEAGIAPLRKCVQDDLAETFDRAIFLVGAPAQTEEDRGEVSGAATTEGVEADLDRAGIDLAEDAGAIGGVTGALVAGCFRANVPAAVLIVRCDPRLPDPEAARSVIESALKPLVEFDIDTSELAEQAEQIQQQKQQLAAQLQQMQGDSDSEPSQTQAMFQ